MKKIVSAFIVLGLAAGAGPRAALADPRASDADQAYLRELMRDTWHFLDTAVSPNTGLPYDSLQSRDLTNTTNVGMYLASLCVAYQLGYLTEEEALARARRILDSLDRIPHWRRLYSNWIDVEGRPRPGPSGPSNISDYNKLPAALVVLRQTFPALGKRCTAMLDEIPWRLFYERDSGKTCYEFDVDQQRVYNPVNFFRGEDKILGHFLMIASGQVPASSWEQHDLQEEECEGYRYYRFGWQGGGLFMHFICGLFLDDRGTLEGRSSANFAWAQIVHAQRIGAPVWGWSASAAPGGGYLGMGHLRDEVVTPHASALALHLFPREAIDNLRRLEALGLRRPCVWEGQSERFGFRDSVDWSSGEVADTYLVLDQAMLFLSLANFCEDGVLWRTFGADPLAVQGKQLIPEYRDAPARRAEEAAYVAALSLDEPGVFWWKEGGPAPFGPDRPLRRTLYARSFSQQALSDVVVCWQVSARDGTQLRVGRVEASLAPQEVRPVATVEIPVEQVPSNDAWTLEATCAYAGKTTTAWRETVFFDDSHDLSGPWRATKDDEPTWSGIARDDDG